MNGQEREALKSLVLELSRLKPAFEAFKAETLRDLEEIRGAVTGLNGGEDSVQRV